MSIVLLGDAVLSTPTLPVDALTDDTRRLAEEMEKWMVKMDGIGLAANQIGVSLQVFVLNKQIAENNNKELNEKEHAWIMNPFEYQAEGEMLFNEQCLSCPELTVPMKRYAYYVVQGVNIKTGGDVLIEGTTPLAAAALQHEMEHLAGKTIFDTLSSLKKTMYRKKLHKRLKYSRS